MLLPSLSPAPYPQIHHALCDMLSSILLPLVRSDAPQRAAAALGPAPLEPWYAAVAAAGREITSWMNKHPKHINVRETNAEGPELLFGRGRTGTECWWRTGWLRVWISPRLSRRVGREGYQLPTHSTACGGNA